MKLIEWAKTRRHLQDGVALVREGKMPVLFEITPSGTILVHEPEAPKDSLVALYARARLPTGRPILSVVSRAWPKDSWRRRKSDRR